LKDPLLCSHFDTYVSFVNQAKPTPKSPTQSVRLTEHVKNPGCSCKISKGILRQAFQGLPESEDPRVLVGASHGDDAGVMDLGGPGNTILTIDVFTPAVDDPYLFGQIAAANSISDIYAMGGTAQAALCFIGFPIDVLPVEAMREILRGGIDKMKEAGVPVIGGHSINDTEPKCGFAVLGTCPKDLFVRNAGALPGDVIVLTKPLGSGIIARGRQIGKASDEAIATVARSMAELNRIAGEGMIRHGVHAATDVTGFSLMGHMAEIVRNSQVEAEIVFDDLPLFPDTRELAFAGALSGAVKRNRDSVDEGMLALGDLNVAEQGILFSPETSGGILAFLPPDRAAGFVGELQERGVVATRIIGRVTQSAAAGKIRIIRGK